MQEWNNIVENCQLSKEIIANKNDSLNSKIQFLLAEDIRVRMGDYSIQEYQQVDSLNRIGLSKIIKKHGWPGIHLLGGDLTYLLLLHTPFDLQKEYIKTLKKEVFKGNFSPEMYASFVDDVLSDHKQIYGMKNKYNWSNPPPAMIDIKTINENRKEIGMISFEMSEEMDKIINK